MRELSLDRLNQLRDLDERIHGGELTGTGILEMAAGIHELLGHIDALHAQLDNVLDELDVLRPLCAPFLRSDADAEEANG